jgi:putative endonuclease
MWYIYALKSLKDGHLYIGMSENPKKRLTEHNSGMTKSTKLRRPFIIIYEEECSNRYNARKREKYLKSGCGREFLKQFMPR